MNWMKRSERAVAGRNRPRMVTAPDRPTPAFGDACCRASISVLLLCRVLEWGSILDVPWRGGSVFGNHREVGLGVSLPVETPDLGRMQARGEHPDQCGAGRGDPCSGLAVADDPFLVAVPQSKCRKTGCPETVAETERVGGECDGCRVDLGSGVEPQCLADVTLVHDNVVHQDVASERERVGRVGNLASKHR